jgi:hypothetical protein
MLDEHPEHVPMSTAGRVPAMLTSMTRRVHHRDGRDKLGHDVSSWAEHALASSQS